MLLLPNLSVAETLDVEDALIKNDNFLLDWTKSGDTSIRFYYPNQIMAPKIEDKQDQPNDADLTWDENSFNFLWGL